MRNLVAAIKEKIGASDGQADGVIGSAVLFIALSAFGDALIGDPLRDMLGQDADAGRQVVAGLLARMLADYSAL